MNVYFSPTRIFKPSIELLDKLICNFSISDPEALILIGGDFNARVGSLNSFYFDFPVPHINSLRDSSDTHTNGRETDLIPLLEEHGFVLLNGRTPSDSPANFTFISTQGRSVVDHVWCPLTELSLMKDLKIADWPTCSDHLPVVLFLSQSLLSMSQTVPDPKPPRFRWNSACSETFREILRWSPHVCVTDLNVDHLNNNLINAISHTSAEIGLLRNSTSAHPLSHKNKPWFDSDCRLAKDEFHRLFKVAKSSNFDPTLTSNYLNAKFTYKSLTRQKRNEFTESEALRLSFARNSKDYWDAINKIRNPIRKNPDIAIGDWADFLHEIFPRSDLSIPITDLLIVPELDCDITLHELLASLKTCKSDKAPGLDGINYDFIKNLPENWLLYLVYFFNLILRSETVPAKWCELLIFPLHKKGNESLPGNYRLISLVNCIAKIFMQILLRRIEIFCARNELIPEFQSGFRRGRSCADNIFTLDALIQINTLKPKSRVYAIFVDFKAAFDSIDHSLLWIKLKSLGLSSKILNTLRSFYSRAAAAIRTNNVQTPFVDISRGVLQGEVLSPLLFSLFLSDLESYIRARECKGIKLNSDTNVFLLAYADDLVLFADSPYEVNRTLGALASYCEEFSLTVNTDKTKIVLFKKDRAKPPIISFKFNSDVIRVVDSYNYLGITFYKNCKFDHAFNTISTNTKLAIGSTLRVINSLKTSD